MSLRVSQRYAHLDSTLLPTAASPYLPVSIDQIYLNLSCDISVHGHAQWDVLNFSRLHSCRRNPALLPQHPKGARLASSASSQPIAYRSQSSTLKTIATTSQDISLTTLHLYTNTYLQNGERKRRHRRSVSQNHNLKMTTGSIILLDTASTSSTISGKQPLSYSLCAKTNRLVRKIC